MSRRLILLAAFVAACGGTVDSSKPPVDSVKAAPAADTATAVDTALGPGMISAASRPVFTAAQAARGQQAWTANCARCHSLTQHSGAVFDAAWNHRTVGQLYDRMVSTMPQDDPGSLSGDQYADIVAYVLSINGMPSGKQSLPPDPAVLRTMRIDTRSKASP